MRKVLLLIIYVLSIVAAFQSGLLHIFMRSENRFGRRTGRVHYRSFYDK